MRPVVEVTAVSKEFSGADGSPPYLAVASISFKARPGEVVCIVGQTGCGKSTIVNMMLGLEPPTSGSILVDGVSPSDDFMGLKRRVAAVFQTDRLLPWRTVVDNAALGLEAAGIGKDERQNVALHWLERVGLARWAGRYLHELSGGMRQRVALVRAFVLDPVVLILDEAFGHLDEVTAQKLRKQCLGLIAETNKVAVVVTHNISEALEIGNRVLVLGRPAQVLHDYDLSDQREHKDWEKRHSSLRSEIFSLIEGKSDS